MMPFNETVMDHVHRPRNSGPMPDATHMGCVGIPGEGRYIKLYLSIADGKIARASYECNGCPASIASASLVCQLVTGKATKFAELIEPGDLLVMLKGLPDGRQEMADFAIKALRLAVEETS